MPVIPIQEFWLLTPEILLALAGMALLISGSLRRGPGYRACEVFSVVSFAATAVLSWWTHGSVESSDPILSGMFVYDDYAFYWKLLLLFAAGATVLLSARFLEEAGYRPTEYYSLIMIAVTGMLFMVSGASLLSIWISLELMALPSYILAGYFTQELRSNEAALKYFVLGAFSSAILLYGVSLLYGATGTVALIPLADALPAAYAQSPLLVSAGWILLAAGLLFKVAAVPFHVWTPDVYEGSPTPVTAFLAAASKGASFAILIRIFYQGLPSLKVDWQIVLAAVSALTMVWGNLAALTQTNVKRMLAYSSIAHAGYILMGVLAFSADGLWAVLFYLLAYILMTMGVFGTVIILERREYAGETYSDYAGLASRSPILAFMMLIFMLALTGIPPTGGFFGKVYLFAAAVEAGWTWLAIVGVLTSAVSLYYYLGIVVQMYFKEADDTTPIPLAAPSLMGAVALCALATILLGIFPGPFVELAKSSLLAIP